MSRTNRWIVGVPLVASLAACSTTRTSVPPSGAYHLAAESDQLKVRDADDALGVQRKRKAHHEEAMEAPSSSAASVDMSEAEAAPLPRDFEESPPWTARARAPELAPDVAKPFPARPAPVVGARQLSPGHTDSSPRPQPLYSVPIVVQPGAFPDAYFEHFGVNPTYETKEQDTSTFSVDVDTASYNITKSYITSGSLPPDAAVRVEEFVNSFDYGYQPPSNDVIGLAAEAFPSPNRRGYHVLQIGLKAREVDDDTRRPLHLIFVVDKSGSMDTDDRIGLVRNSLLTLVDQLGETDTVGIVSFNRTAQVELEPTSATDRIRIERALNSLQPGGSTNVAAGVQIGYDLAEKRLDDGGVHRVILISDGVANEGITEADGIFDTVRAEAERGVTVTTVGVGKSNFNDVLLNRFAQLGKGNYFYIDGPAAARRIFAEQLAGTTEPVAKDVKVQVVFDPAVVARYRLLGYESRALNRRDFSNDRVDGGEMGVGHSVTALYEVKLLRTDADLGLLRIRYKPTGLSPVAPDSSDLVEARIVPSVIHASFQAASAPARLALVAAAFGEKLRGSYWARNLSYGQLVALWRSIDEPLRRRRDVLELGDMIREAQEIDRRGDPYERDFPLATMDFDRLPVLR